MRCLEGKRNQNWLRLAALLALDQRLADALDALRSCSHWIDQEEEEGGEGGREGGGGREMAALRV